MRTRKSKKMIYNLNTPAHKLVAMVFLVSAVGLSTGYVLRAHEEQLDALLESTRQEEVESFLNKNQVVSINQKHITAKDRKAQVIWEDDLIYPAAEIVQKGEHFAVLNEKRNSISIYGVDGYKGEVLLTEEIVSLDIDRKGNVVTLTLKDDTFTVNEYLNNGEFNRIVTQTSEKGIYPTNLKTNTKGDLLVLTSIDINGSVPKSLIGVFSLDKDVPEIVQGITERDNLVYDIKFEGNKLVSMGDKQSHTYMLTF